MSQLQQLFVDRVRQGLLRKSITDASRWASKYRVMSHPYPGIWTFDHHPWLKEMHDSRAELNVGQKSAQVGFTECVLNIAFYFIDVKKMDVLYVLPNQRPDAADFSSGRFDKALELSEHLRNMFSDVKNVGHKRAGYANLYIRGSNSRAQLKSIPVSVVIIDELDEMDQENIPLALQRNTGQLERFAWQISTPTIPEFGINFHFNTSTQDHFTFPCPSCGQFIELSFPDNIVITAETEDDKSIHDTHLICNKCKAKLPHEDKPKFLNKGKWVSRFADRVVRGFHINQLYSMNLHPSYIAANFLKSKKDVHAEQEFHNSTIGVPHVVAGAKITDEQLDSCVATYEMTDFKRSGLQTMGVDVGHNVLHVVTNEWFVEGRAGHDINSYSKARNLFHNEVRDFEELDGLMRSFNVRFCVVDAQPDRRKAVEFANRFHGRVRLCRYTNGVVGRTLSKIDGQELYVNVDRTSWLDMSLSRFKQDTIQIPKNTKRDFRSHMKAIIRIPSKDKQGNPIAKYETPGSGQDHYAHALTYAEIALPLALGVGTVKTISE